MFGEVKDNVGVVFKGERYTMVKKVGVKDDVIEKHNHPGCEILFTVVKGTLKVFLNDTEIHEVKAGQVLNFKGDNFINAEFVEEGEVLVTLLS